MTRRRMEHTGSKYVSALLLAGAALSSRAAMADVGGADLERARALTAEGLLEVRPGIGTLVAEAPSSSREQRRQFLAEEVEALVVEARNLGLELEDVQESIAKQWKELS